MPRGEWRSSATKTCDVCGREYGPSRTERPSQWARRSKCSQACSVRARSLKAWERRPERTCPICQETFRSSVNVKYKATCGKRECRDRYRREIAAPRLAEQMRAAYASGARKPAKGVSPREQMLWAALRDAGWVWRLRWFDAFGCFELDFALPERKLNVEIDGEEHGWTRRRSADEARDAELVRRGWTIVRITNAEVDAGPADVVARILNL